MSIELSSRQREGRVHYILIALLLMHLGLLSFQIEDPARTLPPRRWIVEGGAPFLNLSSSIIGGLEQLWRNYLWLHGAREENDELQARVRRLALANRSLEEARAENARLLGLLNLKEAFSLGSIGARVVGRAPNYLSNTLYLDRGTADGVCIDSAVVSAAGIVGRVVTAGVHDSQVQLITNADASVGVMLERTRSPGVLEGSENRLLDLSYISNTEEVQVGDTVVTSGLDGIFPKGLPVGKVVESSKGKSIYRIIKVAPNADLIRIEEVLVLTGAAQDGKDGPAPGSGVTVGRTTP